MKYAISRRWIHFGASVRRLPRLAAVAGVMVFGLAGSLPLGGLAPEPDPVPKRWEMDVQVGPLRLATVELEPGKPQTYLYMTYEVANLTDEDLLLAPAFDLSTDRGELFRSGRNVPAAVTKEIQSRLGNSGVLDQIAILGTLLQGPENAKEGLVIWPAPNVHPSEVAVYISGLSGEIKTIEVPDPENVGATKRVTLRKQYMVRYRSPGELRSKSAAYVFEPFESRWILR
ncbi:MAG: hypothetical protein SFZ23_07725 [Planctomycetota bacterium]|nr:hypothetical protein [Planctomycetota bacterium]